MTKTTKKDFEIFQKSANSLIEILGLKAWDIDFVHADPPEEKNLAWCMANCEDMTAALVLSKEWHYNADERAIRRIAHHEVFELLLAEINDLARREYVSEERLNSARHRIIQTLLNVMDRE